MPSHASTSTIARSSRWRVQAAVAAAVVAVVLAVWTATASATGEGVTVDKAPDGTGISLDTTSSEGSTGEYTPIGEIVIAEGATTDFGTEAERLKLQAPEGF